MKISNQNPVTTNLQAEKTKAQEKAHVNKAQGNPLAGAPLKNSGAEVQISDEAQLRNFAKQAALQTPDMNKSRVSELKKKIQAGEYKVDTESLVDKILEDHLATDFGKNNF